MKAASLFGSSKPGRVDVVRKAPLGHRAAALFELPHDAELVPEPILLHGLERHRVLKLRGGVVGSAASKPLLLDVDDCPVGSSHCHDLSDFGHGGARNHNFCHISDPS